MVETITPAGCGSRHRHRLAVALFSLGALAAAAALGALLGLAGSILERGPALAVVAALALVAAAREAGLVRARVPELSRQVPERWRRERPLAAWSLGYGAGLGVGVLTHQPVATFWVAAAGAAAVGDPLVSAACLGSFGLGRAAMVALPTRAGRDAAGAVDALLRRRGLLRPVNVAALAAAAVLIGATPALGQEELRVRGRFDPAAWGATLVSVQVDADGARVVLRRPGRPPTRFPGARSPSVHRDLIAFADDGGIAVVRWTTGEEVARVLGDVDRPALDYPRMAFLRQGPRVRTLEVVDLRSGARRVIVRASRAVDLGGPSLRGNLLAYHLAAARDSQLRVRSLRPGGSTMVVASSRTGVHVNPSLAAGHVAWVESRGDGSYLRLRRVGGGRVRTLARLAGTARILWTTALTSRRAYATRWTPATGAAGLIARNWRP